MSKAAKNLKKLSPLKYPSTYHKRSETPPKFNNYRNYRSYLQKDFNSQCVYCRKPFLETHDSSSFHVEHYKPKSRKEFKSLENDYTNLYFSCAPCNRAKGTYWKDDQKIANPCDFIMSQHLKYDDNRINSITDTGKISEQILKLNTQNSLDYRKQLLKIIETLLYLLANPPQKLSKSDKVEYAKTVENCLEILSDHCKVSIEKLRKTLKIKT